MGGEEEREVRRSGRRGGVGGEERGGGLVGKLQLTFDFVKVEKDRRDPIAATLVCIHVERRAVALAAFLR